MLSLSLAVLAVASLLPTVFAQCLTDQNPYCRGNSKFEQICCPYPNVCYWADRQGTPACCPAGQVCLDRDGITIQPQPQRTTVQPAPAPEPTTIYYTVTPTTQQHPQTHTTYVETVLPTVTTTLEPQPTQGQGTVVITTTEPGVVEGIGSTIVAAGSSVINVFEGAAPTARPERCALPVAGALAVAVWHIV